MFGEKLYRSVSQFFHEWFKILFNCVFLGHKVSDIIFHRRDINNCRVSHAQASDYEASSTKCGSCCKGHQINAFWYCTSNFSKVCKFTPKTITPKKKKQRKFTESIITASTTFSTN